MDERTYQYNTQAQGYDSAPPIHYPCDNPLHALPIVVSTLLFDIIIFISNVIRVTCMRNLWKLIKSLMHHVNLQQQQSHEQQRQECQHMIQFVCKHSQRVS